MIWGIFITTIILIFPIYINIKGIISSKFKDIYIEFYLYNFIKTICIKTSIKNKKIFINFNNLIIKLYPLKNILKLKNKINGLKDFHIINIYNELEIKNNDNLLQILEISNLFNIIFNFLILNVKYNKNYMNITNVINIRQGNIEIQDYFSITFTINLLTIILSTIKKIGGKIIYGFRK